MSKHCQPSLTTLSLVVAVGLIAADVATAEPTFDLVFDGPGTVIAAPGSTVAIEVTGQLVTSNNAGGQGAMGWSIGWSASGARVLDPTVQGTLAALDTDDPPGLRDSGLSYEFTALAIDSDPVRGLDGALSAVVLSFIEPVSLPAEGIADIVKFHLEGTAPPAGETETWTAFYVDGLDLPGSSQPKDNVVVWMDNQHTPSLGTYEVQVTGVPEPTSVSLLISGLGVALLWVARRRRRRKIE